MRKSIGFLIIFSIITFSFGVPAMAVIMDDGSDVDLSGITPGTLNATTGSLSTLLAYNNNGSAGGGTYFDLENVGAYPLTITSWDVNISFGTFNISVYYRPGTSQGFETSSAGWQLMGTDTGVVSFGPNNATPVNVGGLIINPGETYGIAMAGGPIWYYTTGTGSNQVYNNGVLELRAGSANNVAFSSSRFTPRVWNGTVHYEYNSPVAVPMMTQCGTLIFIILLGLGAAYLLRRQSRVLKL
jgi:hypothetical protein